MTEEEVNLLVSGIEDQQGQINYEGIIMQTVFVIVQVDISGAPCTHASGAP